MLDSFKVSSSVLVFSIEATSHEQSQPARVIVLGCVERLLHGLVGIAPTNGSL